MLLLVIGVFTELDRESLARRPKPGLEEHSGLEKLTEETLDKQCSTPIKEMHPSTFQTELNPVTPSSTFLHQLTRHSQQRNLKAGRAVHAQIIRAGASTCTKHANGLVNLYAKCGHLPKAHSIFSSIISKDVVSWNSLITGYSQHGGLSSSRTMFDSSDDRNSITWSAMVTGYSQNGESLEAVKLFSRMFSAGIKPSEYTIVGVLNACTCSSLATLELGKQVHGHTIKHGFSLEVPIGSALSTMYSKCGSLEDGSLVFQRTPNKDVVSWNAMISGLSHNGRGDEALELFEEMLAVGTEPDGVTFVNVISACSHKGFVERGWSYFNNMSDQFGIVPKVDHYACMVDLLSRAGQLKEAKELIESAGVDHGLCLWRILLSACKNHGSCELGAYAGEKLIALGSRESSTYVLLASIYTVLGRMRDVERVWGLMRANGVSKDVGCSWITLEKQCHTFVVGDTMHYRIEEIKDLVRLVSRPMMEEGFTTVLDSSHVEDGTQLVLS
ncbi:BnaA05g09990D [Brassica napus]|uniref:BnaA05g09990D protein n=1 Tax=Brassica napus TaxID=3708 RepID=A0A078FVN9_BRANA|nr:BnaA05g09990D [Brassica napus]